ncbi:MAG: (Fe-S)-binding protein, partial [Deltaproteobacteria bacterium]|nr:(Fe-S)-binding protein [Deltaproteobacteria bacterium]
LFTRRVNDTVGTSCARFVSPLLADRHFKPLATEPFHRRMPSLNSEPGESGLKVAFFVGCLIDKVFPSVAQAVIDVLNYHGVGIYMPQGQGCCGIPALSSGDTETFRRLLRHNVCKLDAEGVDHIVTACATCTSTIKEIWPFMVATSAGDLKSVVDALAEKTMDVNQFLSIKAGLKRVGAMVNPLQEKVTYHDPCHLKKALGVSAEPREVIRAAGSELIEMKDSDACCGMGGSFNLQYYDISSRIGKLKRDNIQATGCNIVATSCPACMMQISDAISRAGDRIVVKHPLEIYAEMIRNG